MTEERFEQITPRAVVIEWPMVSYHGSKGVAFSVCRTSPGAPVYYIKLEDGGLVGLTTDKFRFRDDTVVMAPSFVAPLAGVQEERPRNARPNFWAELNSYVKARAA